MELSYKGVFGPITVKYGEGREHDFYMEDMLVSDEDYEEFRSSSKEVQDARINIEALDIISCLNIEEREEWN